MKLWQKIYIVFFIAFLVTFNLVGVVIIERINNQTLHREVKNCLSEHKSILSTLNIGFPILKNSREAYTIDNTQLIKTFIDKYIGETSEENAYIEILDMENRSIFTNSNFMPPKKRTELKYPFLDTRKYIIRKIEDKSYLFVTSLVHLDNRNYKLSYIREISHIYQERKDEYVFFFEFEAYVCVIFAIFIYLISKFLTKPVNKLIKSTKKISEGNYCERVKISSKDELGTLSKNFNQMAQTVEEKIKELERTNHEKQRFIENLTHELKTPLTSIIGYANLLRTTKVNEEILFDSVDFIYKEGKRLEQLSFKMMDLILLKVDDFELKFESIMDVCTQVKGSLLPKLQERNIDLIVKGEDCTLKIEKDLMKILLSNLIDNGIKACEKNSEIYLMTYTDQGKRIIEVQDTGIGISKDKVHHILEPFYVVDKSRTRANNGAGLGLSICKRIADIHCAKMEIESEEKKGTSVKIIF